MAWPWNRNCSETFEEDRILGSDRLVLGKEISAGRGGKGGRAEGESLRSKGEWGKRKKVDFSHFDAGHFGGFWMPLGEVVGDICQSFLDVDFAVDFHLLLK